MPTYEYQCTQCDHNFDIWQAVGEAPPACPQCGSEVRKVFHVPRVIFKGSGFYVTDLRTEKEAAKSPAPKTDASPETKTESPAASSETALASSDSNPSKAETPSSDKK